MKKILISLNQKPYNDFVSKNKIFEYRKRWPNEKVIAYVYVKKPIKSIALKIDFDLSIHKTKEEIAQIAKSEHPEWYQGTLNYFLNHEYGFAIKALNISKIVNPKSLDQMKKNNILPPQNYTFLSDDISKWIEK